MAQAPRYIRSTSFNGSTLDEAVTALNLIVDELDRFRTEWNLKQGGNAITLGTALAYRLYGIQIPGNPITPPSADTTPASIAVVSGNSQSAVARVQYANPIVVVVKNASGVALSGVPVTWSVPGDFSVPASVTTDAAGQASATILAGTVATTSAVIIASVGASLTTTFTLTVTNAAASTLDLNSVVSQSGTSSAAVSAPPSVLVRDTYGNPVSGVTVTFAVALGGGSGTGLTPTTAPDGTATVGSWTLGAAAGLNTMTATAAGLTGSPITYSANGSATAPTQIIVQSGGAQTGIVAGQAAAVTTFRVRDVSTNPVQGVTVTMSTTSGSLGTTSAVSNATGDVTTTLTTATTVGTATITASFDNASGTTVSVTTTVASTFGTKTKWGIQTQPSSNGNSGIALSQQPILLIQDANGNTVTNATDTCSVAVQTGNAVASGSTTKAAVAGVAAFSGLILTDSDGGANTLRFSGGALTTVDSTGVTLTPPVPVALQFVTQPSNVTTGVATLGCTVQVVDASNVLVPGAANAVTVALTTPGGATLSGTLTVNAASGLATFAALGVDTNGTYTLTATATGLTSAVSQNFTAASASTTVYQSQPTGHTTIHEFFHNKTKAELGTNTMHTVPGVTGQIYVKGGYSNLSQDGGAILDTTAPFGTSQVGRTRGVSGNTYNGTTFDGTGHWNGALLTNFKSEIYICTVYKVVGDGTAFEMNALGSKLTIWHSGHASQDAINIMFLMNVGTGQSRQTEFNWQMRQQGGSSPNVMGQINWLQNGAGVGYRNQLNQWYRQEIIAGISTLGAEVQQADLTWRADGILQVYDSLWNGSAFVNRTLIMNYNNVCYRRNVANGDKAFGFTKWDSVFGGSSTIPLSQNDDIYRARTFVSGK